MRAVVPHPIHRRLRWHVLESFRNKACLQFDQTPSLLLPVGSICRSAFLPETLTPHFKLFALPARLALFTAEPLSYQYAQHGGQYGDGARRHGRSRGRPEEREDELGWGHDSLHRDGTAV